MILLLDNLPALYEKCVEYIKGLAVRKANLCLPGRPATVTAVVAYEPKTADCGKNAIEKFKDRFASADQSVLPSCGIEWGTQGRILRPRTRDMSLAAIPSK